MINRVVDEDGDATSGEEIENSYRDLYMSYLPSGWLMSQQAYHSNRQQSFVRDYIWLGGKPLAQIDSRYNSAGGLKKQDIYYIHTDHLNTPRIATNQNQKIVWRWDSDAFGDSKADIDPDGDGKKVRIRLRFPGQYYDNESKLHYNQHRDYDPKTGRYIQSDPMGIAGWAEYLCVY